MPEQYILKYIRYTVTKANQNETLFWKMAILGMEKPPVCAGTFCPSPIVVFTFSQTILSIEVDMAEKSSWNPANKIFGVQMQLNPTLAFIGWWRPDSL